MDHHHHHHHPSADQPPASTASSAAAAFHIQNSHITVPAKTLKLQASVSVVFKESHPSRRPSLRYLHDSKHAFTSPDVMSTPSTSTHSTPTLAADIPLTPYPTASKPTTLMTTPATVTTSSPPAPRHLDEAADLLGIDKPEQVTQVLKELGVSPWAALLAVGSHHGAVFPDATSETEAGSCHPPRDASSSQRLRKGRSRSSSVGLRKRRLPTVSLSDSVSSEEGISVAEDDIKVKKAFILKLARVFHQYGAPSHRFEHHLEQVSRTLNVKAEFSLLPSLIMVSFEDENGDSSTQLIKVPGGLNMAKLAQVNALCLTLTQGLIDCQGAADLLEGVRAAKDYSDYVIQVTYPICGFGVALLLFQLTWLESAISGFLGLLLGVMSLLADKYSGFGYMFEFLGSLVATFIARSLQGVLREYCFDYVKVTLSSLAVFVPGLALTIAIIELSTKNIVSGTVRLIGALFNSMLYGFGMALGSALVLWDTQPPTNPTTCAATSPMWALVFLLPLSMSVNLIFQSHPHQWPIMTLASAMGYAAYQFFNSIPSLQVQPTTVTALSGLVIGLTGNIYARATNDVAVAPIFSAIMLQVPGALSVKSTLGLFVGSAGMASHNSIDGVTFTFQMLSIGLSLAMGLFLATLLVWPIKGPKPKFLAI
ncbi:hypothetical protein BJ741DRAFT_607622 [Chytriomyces cf. hyalinus JEL632]|nr:hypothetical protein BJ741DRAFT_607622 [Chytriomyces cf. hyalinus JEL632]